MLDAPVGDRLVPRKKKPIPLGDQLRAVRKARDLTQAQLAEATGIDQAVISKFERGEREPLIVQLTQLAGVLQARFTTDGKATVFELE